MKRKMLLVLAVIWGLSFVSPVAGSAIAAEPINFSGGPPASEWYSIAVAIGNVWQKNGYALKHLPGGGVSNVMAVNGGKAHVGISASETNFSALNGIEPFKEKQTKIAGLANLYMTFCALAVWKDSGLRKLTDLKGKVLAPGIKGFTYESIIRKQLKAVGLDYPDMKKVEFVPSNNAADLMKDGHVDAAGKTADKFNSWLMDLSSQREIYLIETPDDVMKKLQAENPGIYPATVAPGIYKGIDKPLQQPGYRLCLVVNADTPADKVYNMVKILAENWVKDIHPVSKTFSDVKPEELALPIAVDYHPGALKYYKERGWIK